MNVLKGNTVKIVTDKGTLISSAIVLKTYSKYKGYPVITAINRITKEKFDLVTFLGCSVEGRPYAYEV